MAMAKVLSFLLLLVAASCDAFIIDRNDGSRNVWVQSSLKNVENQLDTDWIDRDFATTTVLGESEVVIGPKQALLYDTTLRGMCLRYFALFSDLLQTALRANLYLPPLLSSSRFAAEWPTL